jgi:hypothetical protein
MATESYLVASGRTKMHFRVLVRTMCLPLLQAFVKRRHGFGIMTDDMNHASKTTLSYEPQSFGGTALVELDAIAPGAVSNRAALTLFSSCYLS